MYNSAIINDEMYVEHHCNGCTYAYVIHVRTKFYCFSTLILKEEYYI